jgi:hypothetical protein
MRVERPYKSDLAWLRDFKGAKEWNENTDFSIVWFIAKICVFISRLGAFTFI